MKGRTRERDKCELCNSEMEVRMATLEKPYRYDLSGLDNVLLAGIEVKECSKCDVRVPVIPKVPELHKVIANHLVFKQKLLTGKEIKFLRKNVGIAANRLAALLEIDPAHLSRVESGKTPNLGAAADKLARAVITAASDGEDVRKVLLKLADERLDKQLTLFNLKKNHWEKIAA